MVAHAPLVAVDKLVHYGSSEAIARRSGGARTCSERMMFVSIIASHSMFNGFIRRKVDSMRRSCALRQHHVALSHGCLLCRTCSEDDAGYALP